MPVLGLLQMPWKELKDVETQAPDPTSEEPEDPAPEPEPHPEEDPVERARMEEEAQQRREELALAQEEMDRKMVSNRKRRQLRNMLPFRNAFPSHFEETILRAGEILL
jgi:hypothetical protein